ncbi:aspartate-semialdehyde dehydrogenase [Stackebrandtia nassauensis]|uniref:Aspartate-semialdehyde dehydrogenase n=1 Tax=Stackebrandtia nassauensis (strain DSM 44728 / CIP 108903 / NRRL B-16338 / NBRC 102104 / LLR-40K-21) TaxID=446470 RepID=D3Q5R0_STANL|nr:aspartate-semialdehyde dehydrogenase [Stackebrandtia nassauensis]ADD40209.1 aspartate-semialdehyde dehydrogenase [Stackebrandtia nassauensis DSM 44728]
MSRKPTLAVVGATGAVGSVMLDVISRRADVWGEIRLIASPRSAGRKLRVRGEEVTVQAISEEVFEGVDVAHFDLPDEVSAHWVPIAAAKGVIVVDKSGYFRMDPDVPLVVAEANPEAVRNRPKGIIANANCTTLALIPSLAALNRSFGLVSMSVASYQAASGAGQAGFDSLYDQLGAVAGKRDLGTVSGDVREAIGEGGDDTFGAPLALNVVPKVGGWRPDGWTSEELKVRNESRKILDLPDLKVASTCVRVPVATGHSQAVHATFSSPVSADAARKVLAEAPGVTVVDDPDNNVYPMPIDATGRDDTLVGRIRTSIDFDNSLEFFVVGDNLLKGAALNSAQTAELLLPELS